MGLSSLPEEDVDVDKTAESQDIEDDLRSHDNQKKKKLQPKLREKVLLRVKAKERAKKMEKGLMYGSILPY